MQPLLVASLAQLLADRARDTPDAAALHLAGTTLSYAGLAETTARRAATLGAIGLAPGTLLALAADGGELLPTMLAAHWAGHPFMPLDPATAGLRWPQLREATTPPPQRLPAAPAVGSRARRLRS